MPSDIYAAVIDAAHERDLRLAAHLYYLDDAKGLLEAGADLIAHSVRDDAVDDRLVALLMENDVCYCPTLMREVSTFVYESRPAWFDDPFFLKEANPAVVEELASPAYQERVRNSRAAPIYKAALERARTNLKTLADASVGIAMGTDTGPAGRFQGYFEHRELELMVEARCSSNASRWASVSSCGPKWVRAHQSPHGAPTPRFFHTEKCRRPPVADQLDTLLPFVDIDIGWGRWGGGIENSSSPIRTPAVSPTNARPLDESKYPT